MKEVTMEELLNDGMSVKYAEWYLRKLEKDWKSGLFDEGFVEWAHTHGFSAHTASAWHLDDGNYKDYITEYEWHKLWPVNDWERIWINDKLTLRLMLADGEYDHVMPRYYFYLGGNGMVRLLDHPDLKKGIRKNPAGSEEVLDLLREMGDMGCKPNNGTMSAGFYKLSYAGGKYFINGNEADKSEIQAFVESHPNYVYQEYLKPSSVFSVYDTRIPTIRIVTLNPTGNEAVVAGGVLRFASAATGEGNYTEEFGEEDYLLYADINFSNGHFGDARKVYFHRIENTGYHPVSGKRMDGFLPDFESLIDITKGIANRMNLIECMGFDFGLTDSGYKCMEINTQPGGVGMQVYRPLKRNETIAAFVNKKLRMIDSLNHSDRKLRNSLQR